MNILAAEREAACKSDDAKELAVVFVATTDTDVGDHACTRYVLYFAVKVKRVVQARTFTWFSCVLVDVHTADMQ